jgi:hypothetical protein
MVVNLRRVVLATAFALTVFAPLPVLARGQQTLKHTLNMAPRIFVGGITLAGDSNNFSGTLEADNPKCVLTVSSNANVVSNGGRA